MISEYAYQQGVYLSSRTQIVSFVGQKLRNNQYAFAFDDNFI